MSPVATLAKQGPRHLAVWDFIADGSKFFARKQRTGRVIRCNSRDELRNLYRNMVSYGFTTY